MAVRDVGSEWGRWDLHFHTPASYDYENHSYTESEIVDSLKSKNVVAVAVTDHHFMDVKRIRQLQSLGGDALTFFPGIELRSELGGSESVHLIGIFSELSDLELIWTKLQGQLGISPTEVKQKGDENVYVKFEEAADLIHELDGIVSVHVGRKSNSIENIGNQYPYKRAFKTDLAQKIDLFEIGRPSDVASYVKVVFPNVGFQRPLIICSDNHDVKHYSAKAD